MARSSSKDKTQRPQQRQMMGLCVEQHFSSSLRGLLELYLNGNPIVSMPALATLHRHSEGRGFGGGVGLFAAGQPASLWAAAGAGLGCSVEYLAPKPNTDTHHHGNPASELEAEA